MNSRQIRISGQHYDALRRHLFPGDGAEAVALALCGRFQNEQTQILLVHEILPIPYEACSVRDPFRVTWHPDHGRALFEKAMRKHMGILKIHSHPGDYRMFSEVDDIADGALFPSIHGWTDDGLPHASAVMLPDGTIFGRFITAESEFEPIDRILVAGDDIQVFAGTRRIGTDDAQASMSQAFGDKTTLLFNSLKVGVVGCSGTGGWVVEQLSRLGVGELLLVDPDRIERRNLNRIINTRASHVQNAAYKVDILAEAVRDTGLVQSVTTFSKSCFHHETLRALASCDIVFGCMDAVDGRDILNRLAAFYCMPYFDLGVRLTADETGNVSYVCGSAHYVPPGGSSLLSRGVFTAGDVREANLKRTNPEQYAAEVKAGYIRGANVDRPAVVTVNGLCATLALNDLLARLHPFRMDSNAAYRWQTFDLVNAAFVPQLDGEPCKVLSKYTGRGDMEPFMDCIIEDS